MTNGDRIRQMTDEELAEFLNSIVLHCRQESCSATCSMWECCSSISDYQEEWLKQEVKDNAKST